MITVFTELTDTSFRDPKNECLFKLSLLTLTVLALRAYGPHKDINLNSVICLFKSGHSLEGYRAYGPRWLLLNG